MTPLGAVHLVFALLALLFGAVVLRLPKGTRWHRTWGHGYLWSMVGLVATSFGLYNLTGGVTPFHLAAVVAGGTVLAGTGAVLLRRPRKAWMEAHATWMAWSYVGLVAAFVAETSTRFVMPMVADTLEARSLVWLFWTVVGVVSFLVGWVGWWLIRTRLPVALERTPEAMRTERAGDR